jgi:hypothetical protein
MASEIKVDTISEKTSANGVTIDGVNIKDSALATAGSVPLSTIDIDGGTDIGAAIVDADLFIIDDGAGGTNRKTAASRLKTYIGGSDPASADGDTLGTASLEWSDLYLADSSVIYFGNDQDTTLTHTDGTGLTLNSTNKLCFNDASQFIQGASGTVLDIAATDEIELTATEVEMNVTTLDVNGNVDVSGTTLLPTLGVVTAKDLGIGIHIKTADSGGSIDNGADEFVIENSGDAGMTILSGTSSSCNIQMGDSGSGTLGGILYNNSNNQLTLKAGGNAVANSTSGEFVFNEDQNDQDFRIESDNNANMFNINAGSEMMGFGVAAGTYKFKFEGTTSGNYMFFVGNDAESGNNYIQRNQFTGIAPDDNTSEFLNCFDSGSLRLRIFSDGDIQNHDNSYGATSDERIKQDIVDSGSQWDDIKAIKVRKYKKKDDVRKYGDKAWTEIGVIGQELEAAGMDKLVEEHPPDVDDILSDSAFGTLEDDTDNPLTFYEDGDVIPEGKKIGDGKTFPKKVAEVKAKVKGVKYSILYMKAIKALQEAQTRIETLEAKVAVLEG